MGSHCDNKSRAAFSSRQDSASAKVAAAAASLRASEVGGREVPGSYRFSHPFHVEPDVPGVLAWTFLFKGPPNGRFMEKSVGGFNLGACDS